MPNADPTEANPLFIGSPLFLAENVDSCEMTREWVRRQMEESAARMSYLPRQFAEPVFEWQPAQ